MNSVAAINGIAEHATQFMAPMGQFPKNNGVYETYRAGKNDPVGSDSYIFPDFDPQVRNAQMAMHNVSAFGAPLPNGMGMMAGILPAALKIEEHKQMQAIAEKYYEKYIKDFNKKYGFSDAQISDLVDEFNVVTEEICRLIPDEKMQDMYRKYINSYPTMYLSMIPQEALQTKLAVKCVTENQNLRAKVETMSKSVSSLVANLTDLQISAGIPPIVNLMFESMPDPLTAMTDPMYHKYNESIVTYHKLLRDTRWPHTSIKRMGQTATIGAQVQGQPGPLGDDLLRLEPIHYLSELVRVAEDGAEPNRDNGTGYTQAGSTDTINLGYQENGKDAVVKVSDIKLLKTVMENMQSQTGCQPFGDEWNHTGPTPAMNPAMCLADSDKFQAGNPRHEVGRTNMYQAKRDPRGNAQWVPVGNVPALSGGAQQLVTPRAPGWDGVSHMPGVDPRPPMPVRQTHQQMQQQQMQQQMQMQQQQQLQQQQQRFSQAQAYSQPYEVVREYEKPAAKRSGSRKSKDSKKAKAKKSSSRRGQ